MLIKRLRGTKLGMHCAMQLNRNSPRHRHHFLMLVIYPLKLPWDGSISSNLIWSYWKIPSKHPLRRVIFSKHPLKWSPMISTRTSISSQPQQDQHLPYLILKIARQPLLAEVAPRYQIVPMIQLELFPLVGKRWIWNHVRWVYLPSQLPMTCLPGTRHCCQNQELMHLA